MKNQARIIQLLNRLENMLKVEIEKARADQDKDAIKLLAKLRNLIKKIAKFLMRTFTCRSTFLYALNPGPRRKS